MNTTHRNRLLAGLVAVILLAGALVPSILWASAAESRAVVTTTPTGYTKASDVVYKSFTEGKHNGVKNWGARGEDCTFLSPMAEDFYTAGYTYDKLSDLPGASSIGSVPSSALYLELKSFMTRMHDYETNYQETRYLYAYTDCASSNSSQLVTFYSGTLHTSVWDGGKTWNREHTWPNSKGLNGNDENDIMMLRPELMQVNSSRGNKAYGASSSYFDPGESVRGDCARIVLYIYTRWGNTGNMWGTSGVIENVDVLLRWMEEDPVDTWEMGRNDAVESITGTRNVFVDYPEYAFLLFNRAIPTDLVTPSGMAKSNGGGTTETKPTETIPTEETTAPDFEMTQPEPPPATEPDFEMTQPEPPPVVDPDFEMTQPEPPPAPGTQSGTAEDSETDAGTALGCTSAAAGGACMILLVLAAPAMMCRKRKD